MAPGLNSIRGQLCGLILVGLLWCGPVLQHAHAKNTENVKTVIYPGQPRDSYIVRLLGLALSYAKDQHYQIQALGADLPKDRAFDLLGQADGLDVLTGTCTNERVKLALPVHFPIFKGLNGMRIALVHRQYPDKLRDITRLSDLKPFLVGQFHTWSDTEILRANGITVFGGSDYAGLYKMLDKQRIDYFLRSVLEIEQDFNEYSHLQLMIDPHLLIQYPSAYYFYVSKQNPELAKDILKGLEMALTDGSFDKLFDAFFGARLQRLKISSRQRLMLNNPVLCDDVPLEREAFWFSGNNDEAGQ